MTTLSGSRVRVMAVALAAGLLLGPAIAPGAGAATPSSAAALPSAATWRADVHRVYTAPRWRWPTTASYLDARVARGDAHLAIVFDIDNTSIASHYDWPHAVPETLALAERYRARGVATLFVTGRPTTDRTMIIGVLLRAGYHPSSVCMRPSGSSVEAGKQGCRRWLATTRGYTIIANVGNRWTDFTGGYYEHCVVDLPDYGLLG